ncbi:Leucine-rich repeat-containing protein, partial [Pseudomonas savastanoi pv. glycinea]
MRFMGSVWISDAACHIPLCHLHPGGSLLCWLFTKPSRVSIMFTAYTTSGTPASPGSLPSSRQLDSAPFDVEHPNAGFIRGSLPDWYLNAPATLRQALHASHQKTLRSTHALGPIRNRLLSAQAFAAPLLTKAFFERFERPLDVEAFQLMTWRYDGSWKPNPLEQTLLQAALQNFASSNRSRFDPYSA